MIMIRKLEKLVQCHLNEKKKPKTSINHDFKGPFILFRSFARALMSLKVWWCQIMYLFCVQVAKVFSCPLPCLYSLACK